MNTWIKIKQVDNLECLKIISKAAKEHQCNKVNLTEFSKSCGHQGTERTARTKALEKKDWGVIEEKEEEEWGQCGWSIARNGDCNCYKWQ